MSVNVSDKVIDGILDEFDFMLFFAKEELMKQDIDTKGKTEILKVRNAILVAKAQTLLECGRIQRKPRVTEQTVTHRQVNLEGASTDELAVLERANGIYEKYTCKAKPETVQ